MVSQASFNLKFISPDSNEQLLFFAGLSGLIFFAFVALTVVLGRNLLKLYAERREGVAGSKFRTRLVVVSLLLSFLPVIAMFWFSYGLMNRSIDKWFSQPVEEVRADTAAMSALLYDYAGQNAASEAQSIVQSTEFQRAFALKNFSQVEAELREHIPTLQGGFVLAMTNGTTAVSLNAPARWAQMQDKFPLQAAIRAEYPHFQWEKTDYIIAVPLSPMARSLSRYLCLPNLRKPPSRYKIVRSVTSNSLPKESCSAGLTLDFSCCSRWSSCSRPPGSRFSSPSW